MLSFSFYEYRVKPETSTVKLNDQYTAIIDPEVTRVLFNQKSITGIAHRIPNSKILEVAKAIIESL